MDTNTGQSWKKTCFSLTENSEWCGGFKHHNNAMHTAKATLERFKAKNVKALELPSKSSDLNAIKDRLQDITVHQRSPSNLTKLEQFCQEEWEQYQEPGQK